MRGGRRERGGGRDMGRRKREEGGRREEGGGKREEGGERESIVKVQIYQSLVTPVSVTALVPTCCNWSNMHTSPCTSYLA